MSQPMPDVNSAENVQNEVIDDIIARRDVGIETYGTALQPFNGRNSLLDAYEEAMDLTIYLKQKLIEEDAVELGNVPVEPMRSTLQAYAARLREKGRMGAAHTLDMAAAILREHWDIS